MNRIVWEVVYPPTRPVVVVTSLFSYPCTETKNYIVRQKNQGLCRTLWISHVYTNFRLAAFVYPPFSGVVQGFLSIQPSCFTSLLLLLLFESYKTSPEMERHFSHGRYTLGPPGRTTWSFRLNLSSHRKRIDRSPLFSVINLVTT